MFNIGGTELFLILIIAFVVVGPKDLPKVARALGRFVRKMRLFMKEIKEETGFDEVEKELKGVSAEVRSVGKDVTNTLKEADIRSDIKKEFDDIHKEVGDAVKLAKDEPAEAQKSDSGKEPEKESPDGTDAAPDKPKTTLGFKEFAEKMGGSGK